VNPNRIVQRDNSIFSQNVLGLIKIFAQANQLMWILPTAAIFFVFHYSNAAELQVSPPRSITPQIGMLASLMESLIDLLAFSIPVLGELPPKSDGCPELNTIYSIVHLIQKRILFPMNECWSQLRAYEK
jgi:hypothetical protein